MSPSAALASTDVHVEPATRVAGAVEVPGDKSISHRALLVALLGTRRVDIAGLATGDDVMSTLAAVEQLGATVERDVGGDPTHVAVTGVGLRGLRSAGRTIDAGNAGTLARLLSGILAGQDGTATIVGDESLSARPMRRVSRPLSALGATVETEPDGTLPLRITGASPLHSGTWEMEVASAQIQSMLLLAGLYADDDTYVVEPARVRDHTERMLRVAGVPVERRGNTVRVSPVESLELPDTVVPADPSAAAGFAVAALVLPGSLLRLPGICANPGRFGFFELAERMGGRVATQSRTTVGGEPVVDLEITPAPLTRALIDREDVPSMIDELPLLALLAHFCKGQTMIRGAGELRHKETDRIANLVLALRRIGVAAEERTDGDGLMIRGSGSRLDGGEMDAMGDHRLAMLGGIAGLISRRGVTVRGADCVSVSYPGFFEVLDQLRG